MISYLLILKECDPVRVGECICFFVGESCEFILLIPEKKYIIKWGWLIQAIFLFKAGQLEC